MVVITLLSNRTVLQSKTGQQAFGLSLQKRIGYKACMIHIVNKQLNYIQTIVMTNLKHVALLPATTKTRQDFIDANQFDAHSEEWYHAAQYHHDERCIPCPSSLIREDEEHLVNWGGNVLPSGSWFDPVTGSFMGLSYIYS